LEIKPADIIDVEKMDKHAARKTRSVIMFIGPLMHELSEFKIPYAGGCELGRRTVRPHLYGLEEFGTEVYTKSGHYQVAAKPAAPKRPVVLYESGDTRSE